MSKKREHAADLARRNRLAEREWRNMRYGPNGKLPAYPDIQQAIEACRRLGITTPEQYHNRYTEDPQLPPNPHIYYQRKGQWKGFEHFAASIGIKNGATPGYKTPESVCC
jgi:hypothetical protein